MNDKILLAGIIDLMIIHSKKNYRKINIFYRLLALSVLYPLSWIVEIMPDKMIAFILHNIIKKESFDRVVIKGINSKAKPKTCPEEDHE